MPFIAKVTREQGTPGVVLPEVVSTFAVATLDAARSHIRKIVVNSAFERGSTEGYPHYDNIADFVNESGGTITLPDGMTVEVESGPGQQVMRQQLREWGVAMDTRDALDDTIAFAWVFAFNAKFAAGSPSVLTEEG
jgi:hypothetical protein